MKYLATIKTKLKCTILYDLILYFRDIKNNIKDHFDIMSWRLKGSPVPPPNIIKQQVVRKYGKKYSIDQLVETGTYHGEMIDAVKCDYNKIYTIELDHSLFEMAEKRFSSNNHITVLHGDSASILPKIMQQIEQPCLFWLDAHYSGGVTTKGDTNTPVMKELEIILSHNEFNNVILIDDARDFTGEQDYPSINELRQFVFGIRSELSFVNQDDIIRICKK